MSLPSAKNLARKIYHRSRYKISRIRKSFAPKENLPILFVFGGRSHFWNGMGKMMYQNEPVFRESIQRCDRYIMMRGDFSILSNFEGTADEHFFEDEQRLIISIASLQIAFTDLYISKGVYPDAVFGVSQGELMALYAAGGLSLEDTLCMFWASSLVLEREKREYISLIITTGLANAKKVFKTCPLWIEVAHEAGDNTVLAFCHQDDVTEVGKYLQSQKIGWRRYHDHPSWPYHTSKVALHQHEMREMVKSISPKPLRCDYYSCLHGKLIPKYSIVEKDFFIEMLRNPVLFNTTSRLVANAGFGMDIHIGPHPFLRGQIQKSFHEAGKQILSLDSMRNDAPELSTFAGSLKALKEMRAIKPVGLYNDATALENFKDQLNVNSILITDNPYTSYEYLRQNGKIHFLKQHKAWLLLDYEDIDYVINNPNIYSNNVLYEFDRFLLGADPPDHTVMRAALQPLFAPQGSGLDEFIKKTVNELLDKLAVKPQFDFVEEFSLPLVKMVINEFLGLKAEDAEALEKILTGHAYEIRYLKDLEAYFTTYLERIKDEGRPGMGTILLNEVAAGNLPFSGAVSLMKLMWLAGTSTTSILLSNAVNMMLKAPTIAVQIRNNERVIPKFIEECLRIEPPELQIWRLVKEDTELAGQKLKAGSLLMLGIASANRDPRVFNNPDSIILNRPARRHFTFGGGYHYCLGVAMARLEAKISLQAVLEQLPNLKFAEGSSTLQSYYPSDHFRALGEMMVTNVE